MLYCPQTPKGHPSGSHQRTGREAACSSSDRASCAAQSSTSDSYTPPTPDSARIQFELANCWLAFGVPENALPHLRELLALRPPPKACRQRTCPACTRNWPVRCNSLTNATRRWNSSRRACDCIRAIDPCAPGGSSRWTPSARAATGCPGRAGANAGIASRHRAGMSSRTISSSRFGRCARGWKALEIRAAASRIRPRASERIAAARCGRRGRAQPAHQHRKLRRKGR